ncbi:MAG: 2-amino-4-hydroxy-6-hydroxymethyldihydropteridine diphosphokinase [Methyloligella sp. ZOD6]
MRRGNVFVALGANLPGPWGTPLEAVKRAAAELDRAGTRLVRLSPIYESAAIGQPGQPPYVNAIAEIATHLPPESLLRKLKRLESRAGRRGRNAPWGARNLDLDIVDYDGRISGWHGSTPIMAEAGPRRLTLPHPQAHLRPFVLVPLADIAPDWRHPVLKRSVTQLQASVPGGTSDDGLRRLVGAKH